MVSTYIYLLMCLTDFSGQASLLREPIALALVYVIGIAVLVNLGAFAKFGVFRLKLCIIRRQNLKKYLAELEAKRNKLIEIDEGTIQQN